MNATPQPTDDEKARLALQVGVGMLEIRKLQAPIIDAAEGLRADLERRGWSPTIAEAAAGDWLRAALVASFQPSTGGHR